MGEAKNKQEHQNLWLVVAISSAVALAALVSEIRANYPEKTPSVKYLVSATAITTGVAALYALFHSFKAFAFMLKIEAFFAFSNLVLWVLAIAVLFHKTDLATSDTAPNTVTNANLYYFSWLGLIFSCLVFGKMLDDKHPWFENLTSRFNMWGLLVLTSIVSMASGTNWWRDSSCKSATTKTTTCQNLELAFAFGAIVAGLSLITMMAAFCMKERKNIMIMWEAFVAVVGVVLWASATRRLTQPNAPASAIGNLYYFTWLSLLVSIMLLWDTIMEKFKLASAPNAEAAEVANEEMEAKSTPPPEAAMPETQAAPVGETQV